jgi:hypothetical protein
VRLGLLVREGRVRSAPAGPARAAGSPARAPASRFGAALARARAALPATAAGLGPALAFQSALPALARRRRLADDGHAQLRERREEADPGRTAASPLDFMSAAAAAAARPPEAAPALLPPRALEQLALAARELGGRPSVELTFGRDLRVTLLRAERGVEVVLAPAEGLHRAADAELPGLVAALRAGGVVVTRAEVRATSAPQPSATRGRALTAQRASATTARTLDPDGTVAKW